MRNTRKYEKEFRINAVKHWENSEKSVSEIAEALGVPLDLPLQGGLRNIRSKEKKHFLDPGTLSPVMKNIIV